MLNVFSRIKVWVKNSFSATAAETSPAVPAIENTESAPAYQLVAYDETLLERTRLQWHLGDWASLVQIDRDTIACHPDRAKLALLVAAGMMQTDRAANAAAYVQLAREWGCSKKLIAQILIAGVHNTLGRAAVLMQDDQQADQHFRLAVASGSPGLDGQMIARTRAMLERERLVVMTNVVPSLPREHHIEKMTSSSSVGAHE